MSGTRVRLEYNYFWSSDPAIADLPAALVEAGFSAEVSEYMGFTLDYELAVHVVEWAGDHVLDALLAVVLAKLAGWSRVRRQGKKNEFIAPERRVRIYGPDGEVLREVVLPAEGADDTPTAS